MLDPKSLDEIAKKITESLPPGLKDLPHEFEKNIRSVIQSIFAKLDLVTREEFDVQTKVLARTREKVEALEKQIALLEEKLTKNQAPE